MYLQFIIHEFINLHDSSFITAFTKIWGWKDCDHIALVYPVVSVHYNLMRICDPIEVILAKELVWDVLAKRVTKSSLHTPGKSIIRKGLKKIAYWPKFRLS